MKILFSEVIIRLNNSANNRGRKNVGLTYTRIHLPTREHVLGNKDQIINTSFRGDAVDRAEAK